MVTSDQLKTKTGDLGEKLVARYFRQNNSIVEESLDLFDRSKDMSIDGESCEVKTQQPWHKEQAFTVKPNQLQKCLEVDRLIFVETPSKYNGNCVKLYEIPKDKRQTRVMRTSDNRTMHLYSKKHAILLTTITDHGIIEQFRRYTMSTWR